MLNWVKIKEGLEKCLESMLKDINLRKISWEQLYKVGSTVGEKKKKEIIPYFKQLKTEYIGEWPGFPKCLSGKELPANAKDIGSISRAGRFPWRRKWQPTRVFLPAKFHIQRSLVGYNPWGCKESDMTRHARAWPELPFYLGGMMEWGNGDGAVGMVRKKTDVPSLPGKIGKAKWERISLSDSSPTQTTCCEGNVNTKTIHSHAQYFIF